jgi:hypothetical protein
MREAEILEDLEALHINVQTVTSRNDGIRTPKKTVP